MCRRMQILCAAMALLLTAGCGVQEGSSIPTSPDASVEQNGGGEAAHPSAADERLYSIPLGEAWISDRNWVIDRDGNDVYKVNSPEYFELSDLALHFLVAFLYISSLPYTFYVRFSFR